MFIDEREEGGEGERNIDLLPPVHMLARDWALNLSMCPDWWSNKQHFGATNWATQPGMFNSFEKFQSFWLSIMLFINLFFVHNKLSAHIFLYLVEYFQNCHLEFYVTYITYFHVFKYTFWRFCLSELPYYLDYSWYLMDFFSV